MNDSRKPRQRETGEGGDKAMNKASERKTGREGEKQVRRKPGKYRMEARTAMARKWEGCWGRIRQQ